MCAPVSWTCTSRCSNSNVIVHDAAFRVDASPRGLDALPVVLSYVASNQFLGLTQEDAGVHKQHLHTRYDHRYPATV